MTIDKRLLCDICGEPGEVKPMNEGFVVTCKRDGKPCCQSYRCNTEAEAIAAWVRMQNDASWAVAR